LKNNLPDGRAGRQRLLDDGFKERIVSLIEEGEDEALFSKTLATIRRDAPVTYHEPEMEWLKTIDIEKYLSMCDLYEFRSMRNRLHTMKDEGGLAQEIIVEEKEEITDKEMKELQVMIHLLHSEMTKAPREDIENYTGEKTFIGMQKFLEEELKKENLYDLFVTVEKPLIACVDEMERNGITLDVKKLKAMSDELHAQVKVLEQKIYDAVGMEFNIASPKQLGDVLYDKLNLGTKIKKTKTGQKSTNVSELEKIKDEHPSIPYILEYRELTKLLSTYIDTLPTYVKDDGRIHAHFVQTGSGTGRFSCEDPNLQNIPVKSELGQKVRIIIRLSDT
jgi:DNA polymerase-1